MGARVGVPCKANHSLKQKDFIKKHYRMRSRSQSKIGAILTNNFCFQKYNTTEMDSHDLVTIYK